MNKTWTNAENEYIRTNAGVLTDQELAQKLSEIRGKPISIACLRKQRQRLGLTKSGGRGVTKLKFKGEKNEENASGI